MFQYGNGLSSEQYTLNVFSGEWTFSVLLRLLLALSSSITSTANARGTISVTGG
jgi:hypothetical protein